MLASIVSDFGTAGIQVAVPMDPRLTKWMPQFQPGVELLPVNAANEMRQCLADSSTESDYIMLIAPESDSRLLNCVKWMASVGDKLISPDTRFVEMASCKTLTVEYLQSKGFESVPVGMRLSKFIEENWRTRFRLPAVLKPNDGAGSEGVRLITDWNELDLSGAKPADQYRIESFVSGTPVSVSVLCGGANQLLAPTRQVFDREPFGDFVDAQYPLAPEIAIRAIRLAMDAVKALPETRGYIGIDMIISDIAAQFDCLIEVNPRLTMSYLKLREIYEQNLAMLMLNTAIPLAEFSDESSNKPIVKKPGNSQAPYP